MTLRVIGTGFGRTATYSLRAALEKLGFNPCYHMETVLTDMENRVPQWNAALSGNPDWASIYDGHMAAVDWPTAAFWRGLLAEFPDAKFIHSTRSAESWYDSFSQTILAVLSNPDKWPEPQHEWLTMVEKLVCQKQFGGDTGRENLIATFKAHEAAVTSTIPAERLLVFQASDGWEPLCAFLDRPVPSEPYPRSNSRQEFFELMAQGAD